MRGRQAPFVVHVAGAPEVHTSPPSAVQRCVACGAALIDNTGWLHDQVAVPEGDDSGPAWWPVTALVATDKEPGTCKPSMTYVVEQGRALDDDEQPCVLP